MKKIHLTIFGVLLNLFIAAQITVYDTGRLNQNEVIAPFTSEGSLTALPKGPGYFVPKDSGGTATIYCGALWIGGLDESGILHMAAQTYHQNGTDFWPGPIMDSVNYSPHQDTLWNHVWIVYKSTIDSFIQGKFGNTIPPSIQNWPANGDVALGEMAKLAPYVNVSNSGYYNPSAGDYPEIRGDMALYAIFNDARAKHTETRGKKLNIEVHLMAYQFSSSDTAINEATFLHYDIYNLSKNNYDSVYIGNWIDMDVGNGTDNYIGCDSAGSYWYTYMASAYDPNGTGQYGGEKGFGPYPSAQSLAYMCDTMTHFMYYNNDFSNQGNPDTDRAYYNYMKDIWIDGTHATYGGSGYGGSSPSNYMYSGNPAIPTEWSEVSVGNMKGDRRGISSIGPISLPANAVKSLDLALVFAEPPKAGLGNIYSVNMLPAYVNDARNFYNQQGYGCDAVLGVNTVKNETKAASVLVYPNPSKGVFTLMDNSQVTIGNEEKSIEVYNELGQLVYSKLSIVHFPSPNGSAGRALSIDLSSQPDGVYLYRVISENGDLIGDGKLVVQH